jgi:hypothetical protein
VIKILIKYTITDDNLLACVQDSTAKVSTCSRQLGILEWKEFLRANDQRVDVPIVWLGHSVVRDGLLVSIRVSRCCKIRG